MAQTALITGASSGIGMEFAGVFAREGYDLVLVARDADKLAKVREVLVNAYGRTITFLPLDLAAAGAPEALYEALEAQNLTIDVLVNNAGIGDFGRFAEEDLSKLRALLRTNVVVPTLLARLLGAKMVERGSGAILNVASIASFMPGPWMAAYFASKAHLLSLSEALAVEFAGSGVKVTALCPGPTETPFIAAAHQENSGAIKGKKLAHPKDVAEYGYRALKKGKRVAVHGFKNKLLTFALRFVPRDLIATQVWRMQAPR